MEARIVVTAEPLSAAEPRKVAVGYGLYVAVNNDGRPVPVAPFSTRRTAEVKEAEDAARGSAWPTARPLSGTRCRPDRNRSLSTESAPDARHLLRHRPD